MEEEELDIFEIIYDETLSNTTIEVTRGDGTRRIARMPLNGFWNATFTQTERDNLVSQEVKLTPFQTRMAEKQSKRDEVIKQSEIKHKVTLISI